MGNTPLRPDIIPPARTGAHIHPIQFALALTELAQLCPNVPELLVAARFVADVVNPDNPNREVVETMAHCPCGGMGYETAVEYYEQILGKTPTQAPVLGEQ